VATSDRYAALVGKGFGGVECQLNQTLVRHSAYFTMIVLAK
jgi:hypothetical protein